MLHFVFYGFCISFVWASPSINKLYLKDIGSRIFNGEPAVLGQFPWQAALVVIDNNSSYWFCGGSIISEEWILTAAHCLNGAHSVEAYTGVVDLYAPEEHYELGQLLILHEDYDPVTVENDIALVKLDNPIDFNVNRTAIALSSDFLEAGVEVTVSGWGKIAEDDVLIYPLLNYIIVTTIDNKECEQFFGEGAIFDGMMCSVSENDTVKNPCSGDGGSPVVVNADTDPIQVGIVSFIGLEGCEKEGPAGYTRIAYYRDWIKAKSGV